LAKPLGTLISNEHPLFVLGGGGPDDDPSLAYELWKMIPESLKEYSVFPFEMFDVARADEWGSYGDEHGFPLLWQVRTWVPPWHPYWKNGNTGPGVEVEKIAELLDKHPSIKGIQVCEFNNFGFSTEEKLYVSDLLKTVAEAGRYLSWREGNDGCNIWVEAGLEKWFSDDLRAYGEYLLPQWEMNISRNAYLCHDSVFGLWLAGWVSNWGVEPQSWYWSECGFTDLNTPTENHDKGYRKGDKSKFPPTMWGEMIALGLNSGATVYNFEPMEDSLFTKDLRYPPASLGVVFPLLQDIVEHRLIPSKEEVIKNVKVAYVADFESGEESEVSDVDYYRGSAADNVFFGRHRERKHGTGTLYKATYGITHEHEMIPDSGRYYWIPVLPKYTRMDFMNKFERVLCPNQFTGETEAKIFFDKLYPPIQSGSGYITLIGDEAFAMNSFENMDLAQGYSFKFGGLEFSGELGPHNYFIAKKENRLFLHVNNLPGKETQIKIKGLPSDARASFDPPGSGSFDNGYLRVEHSRGAVRVLIEGLNATRPAQTHGSKGS